MKICSKCGINKHETDYHKDSKNKDGLTYSCKECRKPIVKNYYNSHKQDRVEYAKTYREENMPKILEYREKTKNIKSQRDKERYQANKEEKKKFYHVNKKLMKGRQLVKKYGITLEEYNLRLKNQNNVCAICKSSENTGGRALAVDHDHETGKIRGLLCSKCNVSLGNINDNVEILRKMIQYLEQSAGGVFVN